MKDLKEFLFICLIVFGTIFTAMVLVSTIQWSITSTTDLKKEVKALKEEIRLINERLEYNQSIMLPD